MQLLIAVYHSLLLLPPGEMFASGGADKQVVLWNNDQLNGVLKYSLTDSVVGLEYNPVSQLLLSCTTGEVGE